MTNFPGDVVIVCSDVALAKKPRSHPLEAAELAGWSPLDPTHALVIASIQVDLVTWHLVIFLGEIKDSCLFGWITANSVYKTAWWHDDMMPLGCNGVVDGGRVNQSRPT